MTDDGYVGDKSIKFLDIPVQEDFHIPRMEYVEWLEHRIYELESKLEDTINRMNPDYNPMDE